jgi:predicted ATPase
LAEEDPNNGVEIIRKGMENWEAMGLKLGFPLYYSLLAEALGRAGKAEEAIEIVDEALEHGKKFGDRLVEANLFRIRGDLALAWDQDAGEIEDAYQHALVVSREQHNRSFELQAAMRLAQLWIGQGKLKEGRKLVKGVIDQFREGFQSVDLRTAQKLLGEI